MTINKAEWSRPHRCSSLLFALVICSILLASTSMADESRGPIILNDDGAWCWFQDERALVHGTNLIVGSIANGWHDSERKGDVDVVVHDLKSGDRERVELHDQLEADDHAAPALCIRPDGRVLAVYAKHGSENCFYSRLTASPNDAKSWLPATTIVPSDSSRITYSNLQLLSAENGGRGQLYNFFRGLNGSFKPSFVFSDDLGATWQTGNVVVDVPLAFLHRPYAKYTSNGIDTIHIVYTEGHPRDFDNSLYHIVCRQGQLHRSDGTAIRPLSAGLFRPDEGTRIFQSDANNVAWVSDLHLSSDGHPYLVFSVQKNSAGLSSGDSSAGQDHRYRYARWDGEQWQDHEIGYGGSRLYAGEDDYTGNTCLNPDQLGLVYFSTNVNPKTGQPVESKLDGLRHYELYRGNTDDGGRTWSFAPITRDSTADNLRPIVPKWDKQHTALLWFRGTYHTYRNYQCEIVGLIFDHFP